MYPDTDLPQMHMLTLTETHTYILSHTNISTHTHNTHTQGSNQEKKQQRLCSIPHLAAKEGVAA